MGDPRKKENINGTFFGQGKGKVLSGPFSLPFERQDKHKVYKYNSYFSHRWLNKLWARNPYTQGRMSGQERIFLIQEWIFKKKNKNFRLKQGI